MAIKREFDEIQGIVDRTGANLISFPGVAAGRDGAELRYAVGDVTARAAFYLVDGSFAHRWMTCFRLATQSGINLDWMDRVIKQLVAETPTTFAATSVLQNSLIFALAQEGRIIAASTYKSRNEIDEIMRRMKNWFDIIRNIIADTMSGPSYQAFLNLTAGITRYLTDEGRPLPRMLRYEIAATRPGLTISNYIYGEGGRAEELSAENRVVHPAFMPRSLRALSA